MSDSKTKVLVNNTIMMYIMSITKLVVPLISLPYLARVLSVDCFGSISFVKSIVSYLQIFIEFGFLFSATKEIINLVKNKKDSSKEIGNTIYAQLLLGLISLVIMFVFSCFMNILDGYMLFAMLSVIPNILAIFLFEYVFKAYEQMGKVATRYVVMKVFALILTLLFVKSDNDIILIPIFEIISTTIAVFMAIFQMHKLKCGFNFKEIKYVTIAIKKSFPYFISTIATTAFSALATIFIGIFLTASDVAFWSVTMQILAGIHALYHPIINSSFPVLVKNNSLKLVHKIIMIYMPLILLGCAIIILLGDWLVCLLFTDEYLNSAFILKILIPVIIASFPSMLYGWVCLASINKERINVLITIIGLIIQILGFGLVLILNKISLMGVTVIFVIVEIIVAILRVCFVYKNKSKFKF